MVEVQTLGCIQKGLLEEESQLTESAGLLMDKFVGLLCLGMLIEISI